MVVKVVVCVEVVGFAPKAIFKKTDLGLVFGDHVFHRRRFFLIIGRPAENSACLEERGNPAGGAHGRSKRYVEVNSHSQSRSFFELPEGPILEWDIDEKRRACKDTLLVRP